MAVDVSKSVGYSVGATKDERLSKATGYTVLQNNNLDLTKATGYAVMGPGGFMDISMAVGYAVLESPPPADAEFQVSMTVGYAVLFDDPENYSYVSKATAYSVLIGDAKVSKATNYAVLDDPTPRYIDISMAVGYAVLDEVAIHISKETGYVLLDATPRPEANVSKATGYAVMFPLNPKVILSQIVGEITTGGSPANRLSIVGVEVAAEGNPDSRLSIVVAEPVTGGNPDLRCSFIGVEVVCAVPEEPYMIPIDRLFPSQAQLPGLGFNVKKAPEFSTRIAEHTSGKEVRNAFWDDPRWNYEVNFELLRDRPVGSLESELKKIAGFFMQRRGRYEAFLFRDPDDYQASNIQAETDGVTLTFDLRRDFGGFLERIGQLDQVASTDFWFRTGTEGEEHTVPVTPGPYTVTVDNAADFRDNVSVTLANGTPLLEVAVAPAAMQYSVNSLTGVYTFNSAQQGADILIRYEFDIDTADYEILMPRKIVFDSAPPAGLELWGEFQFYFVCRFDEDTQDYEKFMDKLWELQQCTFKSIIQ